MSKHCKDCEDNSVKHYKIERPDYYIMGVDNVRYYEYKIPVNDALTIGGLKTSYIDELEWFTEASPNYTLVGYGGAFPIFNSLKEGIDFVYDFASTQPSFIDAFTIQVQNKNYGNLLTQHPSFLTWNYIPLKIPYCSIKDPTWYISFPVCTTKNKHNNYGVWKLKDCGVWKIEYRLRVRPIIPMQKLEIGGICFDEIFSQTDGINLTYDEIKDTIRFYKSLESQDGSKYMGVAPMRLESGIYSHDTKTEKPIVWSDGKYPQILPSDRNFWSSKYPKEMSYVVPPHNSVEPTCPRQNWYIGPPNEVIINDTESEPNEEDIFYKYDSNATNISNGLIIPGTNNLINPGTLKFSNSDSIGGNSLLDWLKCFDLSGAYITKVGTIEINIEGKLNGVWTTATTISYDIANVTFNPTDIVLNVYSNSANPTYADNLGSGYSNTQFYNFDNMQTRYNISVINHISGETISEFSVENVKSKSYTSLTEDFVIELEGFTYVDLDKEKEVSIYLKALPDHNDYGSLGIHSMNIGANVSAAMWYPTVNGNTNVSVGVTTSPAWPWAPLSVDKRNKYKEQTDVKYEPLLELDPYWEKQIDLNNPGKTIDPRRNLIFGARGNYNWYIMIEEGWVSAEKVCEDCDC